MNLNTTLEPTLNRNIVGKLVYALVQPFPRSGTCSLDIPIIEPIEMAPVGGYY